MTAFPPPIGRIHEHFCVGDIWFRSSDQILFGICQNRFKQKSAVFNEMLNQPHLKPSPLGIDFELDKDLLEVLLDQLVSLQPKDLKTNFDNTKQLCLTCEKWEIEEATTGVFRQRMYDLSVSDPWDLLV